MSEELEKKTDGQSEKPAKKKDKKPNPIVRFGRWISKFVRETKSELKKVVWPTPKQTFKNTGIVIFVVILCGAVVALVDFGLGRLLQFALGS